MIKVEQLSKSYISRRSVRVDAVKGVDFVLPDKGFVVLFGKSGSGKSTLLNLMTGLDTPTSGSVFINGKDIFAMKSEERDTFRLEHIGIVFQNYNLLDNFNVYDNIAMGYSFDEEDKGEYVSMALERVGLKGYEKRRINELSGGQKQRVAIARAIVRRPDIIFLDEPTGNLDTDNSVKIFDLMKELSRDSLVVVISHNEELSYKYADIVIGLKDGRINPDTSRGMTDNDNNIRCDSVCQSDKETVKKNRVHFKVKCRIALHNMRKRIARLVATIILFALTFAMVGITLAGTGYDMVALEADRLASYNEKSFPVKYVPQGGGAYDIFDNAMYDEFKNRLGKENVIPLHDIESSNVRITYLNAKEIDSKIARSYYTNMFVSLLADGECDIEDYGFKVIAGRLPQSIYEIAITEYEARYLIDVYGVNRESIIGDTLSLSLKRDDYKLIIVGIIDTNFDFDKYDLLREDKNTLSKEEQQLFEHYDAYIGTNVRYSVHNSVFITQELLDAMNVSDVVDCTYETAKLNLLGMSYIDSGLTLDDIPSSYYTIEEDHWHRYYREDSLHVDMSKVEYFDGRDVNTPLKDDEIVVGRDIYEDYTKNNLLINVLESSDMSGHREYIIPESIKNGFTIKFLDTPFKSKKVVGYINSRDIHIIVSKNTIKSLGFEEVDRIGVMIGDTRQENIELLHALDEISNENFDYFIHHVDIWLLDSSETLVLLVNILAYICMAIFGTIAIILLLGFVSSTIKDSYLEAGILRAMGARGRDVAKIYILEIIIVLAISLVLGFILSTIFVANSSGILGSEYKWIKLFNIAWWHLPFIVLLSMVLMLVASIKPEVKLYKSNPIDIMRKKA